MPSIFEEEKLRRRQINESVVGTNAMEGLTLDVETLALSHIRGDNIALAAILQRALLSSVLDK